MKPLLAKERLKVTAQLFWKNFRYIVLIVATVAAIVTPTPSATATLTFMAPMIALVFVSVLVRGRHR